MPNRYNYTSNIANLNGRYTKYMVSRVIDNPQNTLLEVEMPPNIPQNFVLELSFYSLTENYLMSSVFLTSDDTDVVSVTTLRYVDTSIRRLLFIDFSKLNTNIEEGRLQLVINFFIPEVGAFDESKFTLTKISPSRKEIEMTLIPQCITIESIQELKTFASPQINSTWVLDALKYICNQTQSLNTNLPTVTASLSFNIIQSYLPISQSNKINGTDVSGEYTASIKQATQELLNNTYAFASQSIRSMITTQARFTETMLIDIVSSSLGQAVALRNYGSPRDSNFRLV
jgi:hypothetical protein